MPESLDDTYITSNSNITQLIGDIATNHSFQMFIRKTLPTPKHSTAHFMGNITRLWAETKLTPISGRDSRRDKKNPIYRSHRRGRSFHKPSISSPKLAASNGNGLQRSNVQALLAAKHLPMSGWSCCRRSRTVDLEGSSHSADSD